MTESAGHLTLILEQDYRRSSLGLAGRPGLVGHMTSSAFLPFRFSQAAFDLILTVYCVA